MKASEVNYLLYHTFFPKKMPLEEKSKGERLSTICPNKMHVSQKETENHLFSVWMNENEKLFFLHAESVHSGLMDFKKIEITTFIAHIIHCSKLIASMSSYLYIF